MFERFTDRARKVMALANQQTQRLNHEYIGAEDILLALVKEGSGVGAAVLKNLNVDLQSVSLEIERTIRPGPEIPPRGKLPQTPRAKKVIEYAIEESQALNHDHVGTQHLLLGLLREQDGVAAMVLARLNVGLEDVREGVRAAHDRWEESEIPVRPMANIFERFTDRARKVMALANTEARRFDCEYIAPEHILLGLVKEGSGVGAVALKERIGDLRKVRLEVEKLAEGGSGAVMFGKLPQTPRAKKVIEYAVEEARGLNHNYVGTEHLLLGLLHESDGVVAQVLTDLGLQLAVVREGVRQTLGQADQSETLAPPATQPFQAAVDTPNPIAPHVRRRLRRALFFTAQWSPLVAVLLFWLLSLGEWSLERRTLACGPVSLWIESHSRIRVAAVGSYEPDRTAFGLMLQPHRFSVWRSSEVPLTSRSIAQTRKFGPITLHHDPVMFLTRYAQRRTTAAPFPIAIRLSTPMWFLAALCAIPPVIALIRGPLRRSHRRRHGRCPNCAYDLRGSPGPRCPECGMEYAAPNPLPSAPQSDPGPTPSG